MEWVIWLHDRYELGAEERLPLCWALHPGLVEELHALKVWRQEIYGAEPQSALDLDHQSGDELAAGDEDDFDDRDLPRPAAAQPVPNGQAARYWHAELRQVVHAATTIYAAGCRAGHRDAPTLHSGDGRPGGTAVASEGGLKGLRRRWLGADPTAGIPAPPSRTATDQGLSVLALGADPAGPRESDHRRPDRKEPDDTQMGQRQSWSSGRPRPGWVPDTLIRRAVAEGKAAPLGEMVLDYVAFDGCWWTPAPGHPPQDGDLGAVGPWGQEHVGWHRITDETFAGELDSAAHRLRAADDLVAEQREPRHRMSPHVGRTPQETSDRAGAEQRRRRDAVGGQGEWS